MVKKFNKTLIFGLFISIFTMLTFFMSAFLPYTQSKPNQTNADTTQTEVVQDFYIINPTIIESDTNNIYLFDQEFKTLNVYSQSQESLIAIINLNQTILDIQATTNYLFLLTQGTSISTQILKISLKEVTSSSPEITELSVGYGLKSFTAIDDSTLILITNDNEIITGTITTENTITGLSSKWNFITGSTEEFDRIEKNGSKIFAQNGETKIYSITETSNGYNSHNIVSSNQIGQNFPHHTNAGTITDLITVNNTTYALSNTTRASYLFNVENKSTYKTITGYTLSSITYANEYFYAVDTSSQTVIKFKLNENQIDTLITNLEPNVTYFSSINHKHITTTEDNIYYKKPYSVQSDYIIANTRLSIIGYINTSQRGKLWYCLKTNGRTNDYLFLPENASYTTLPQTATETNLKVITQHSYINNLPSRINDSINTKNYTFSNQVIVTQIIVQPILNNNGEQFYLVKYTDGTKDYVGYIQSAILSSPTATTQDLKEKCNGKTKRTTILYLEDPSKEDYTEEELLSLQMIEIKPNSRIVLEESVNAGKNYIKATYQTENGETYTGYINAEDIDPDGLTPLQIIGLVLVLINIIILIIILSMRNRVQKSKTTSIMR